VSNHNLGTVLERGHRFSCNVCEDTKSFVTWMMDLGKSSLDGRDLGKWDACLGRIAWLLYSGSHRHMKGTQEVFESLTGWDSVLHEEICVDTKDWCGNQACSARSRDCTIQRDRSTGATWELEKGNHGASVLGTC
jgi:hypothetical protein